MSKFENLVAIVTGGARGIGASTALRLAKDGAKVAVFDLNVDDAEKVVSSIRDLGSDGMAVGVDVSNRVEVENGINAVVDKYGKLDILVNNAGILRDNLLNEMTDEDWDQVMNVNLKGCFLCSQVAQKYMVKQQYGKIVIVSSQAVVGRAGRSNYASSKAGLIGLTKSLSLELGPFGINVNAVAPGSIFTEMTEESRKLAELRGIDNFDEQRKAFLKNNAIQREGRPEEVANVIAFLSSDEASYVTGQVIFVAGRPVV